MIEPKTNGNKDNNDEDNKDDKDAKDKEEDDEHDGRAWRWRVHQSWSLVSLNVITIVSKHQDHLANEIKSSR